MCGEGPGTLRKNLPSPPASARRFSFEHRTRISGESSHGDSLSSFKIATLMRSVTAVAAWGTQAQMPDGIPNSVAVEFDNSQKLI